MPDLPMEKITLNHPEATSKDLLAERVQVLKNYFPEAISDGGKIDLDALKDLLQEHADTDPDGKYRFTWHGKNLAQQEVTKKSTATLRPDFEESKNWENTENLFIEGDNLEVLKLLQRSYNDKVKMIYIDPPYNTGNEFIYPDDYKDNLNHYLKLTQQVDEEGHKFSSNSETNGRYHSNWLNMMYPRLTLARNLLTEDGVIFISIDDNEVHNLRKICDEIFGEENFLAEIVWNLQTGSQAGHFTKSHQYIITYTKKKELLSYFKDTSGGLINHGALKKISTANPASNILFPAGISIEGVTDVCFKGEIGGAEKQYIISKEMIFKNGKLLNDTIIRAGWAMKNQIEAWLKGEDVWDSKNQKIKRFYFNSQGILWYEKERGTFHPKTVLNSEIAGNSKQGTEEVEQILQGNIFSYPKPTKLLNSLISIIAPLNSNTNDIILDFFAGSGTTAHAVMQLNAEDGGNRKFICVQLPEPTPEDSEARKAGYKTISAITRERIRRAGDKILTELKAKQEKEGSLLGQTYSLPDVGFKAFRLDSSNLKAWDPRPMQAIGNILEGTYSDILLPNRTVDDLLYELMLKQGASLTEAIEKRTFTIEGKEVNIYAVAGGLLFFCLDQLIPLGVTEPLAAWHKELAPLNSTVIFRDSGFSSDSVKANVVLQLKELPNLIFRSI